MFARTIIFCLLFLEYSSAVFAVEPTQQVLSYVIEQATLYRLNPQNSSKDEQARQQAILDEACRVTPHYGTHTKLTDLVSIFLQNHWAAYDPEHKIIDATETGVGGNSSDVVFFVRDQQDTLLIVVKAFRNPSQLKSRFLKELSALALLRQIPFTSATIVQPLAVGRGASNDCEYGLLLESAASGKRVDTAIKNLKGGRGTPADREACLDTLKRAFAQFGQGLAELHATRAPEPKPMDEKPLLEIQSNYTKMLSNHFIRQALVAHGLNLEELEVYLLALVDETRLLAFYSSFQHGSPHLGNLLYDEADNQLIFIDVAKMHPTIDLDARPLGDATLDLMRTEDSLRKTCFGVFAAAEIEEVLFVFYQAYAEHASLHYDGRAVHFHMINKQISRINSNSNYPACPDPKQQAEKRASFEIGIEALKAAIETKSPVRDADKY